MRLKSAIWVAAYIRRCHVEGAFAAVRRRGAEEAGAIFVKVNRLDGTAELFGPAPQSEFDTARPADRLFSRCLADAATAEAKVEERLARELRAKGMPAKRIGKRIYFDVLEVDEFIAREGATIGSRLSASQPGNLNQAHLIAQSGAQLTKEVALHAIVG